MTLCIPSFGDGQSLAGLSGALNEVELGRDCLEPVSLDVVPTELTPDVLCFVDHGSLGSSYLPLSPFAVRLTGAGSRRDPLCCLTSTAASLQDWLTPVSEKGEDNFS